MPKISKNGSYDVIIVGGGNTALLTALRAHQLGGKVLILEKAPKTLRGGNGFFTTGIYRFVFETIDDLVELASNLTEEDKSIKVRPYTADKFFNDYMVATEGLVDPEMMELIIENSTDAVRWMVNEQGIEMEFSPGGGKLPLSSKGGGAGLSDALYTRIEEIDEIELLYETAVIKLLVDSTGKVCGVSAKQNGAIEDIKAKSVILACGGFESNPAWRARYLGKDWDLAKVRGTRFNMGDGLKMAMDIGAAPAGNWSGCHAVFIDAEAPQPALKEEAETTSKRLYVLGLCVNEEGKRFIDEGEDTIDMVYARHGQYALKQPGRIAYQIFDQTGYERAQTIIFQDYLQGTFVKADTLGDLADELAIDPEGLKTTVDTYNADIQPGDKLRYYRLLGEKKDFQAPNVKPPKSGNAFPLVNPPFYAFPVNCGITFNYGGLEVNLRGQVMDTAEKPIPGLYAAGMIQGGLFYSNYLGATGLTAGVVFARICGENAVKDHL